MPADKPIEGRLQTHHKLEAMHRYWGAWCTILGRTAGAAWWCPSHLWLIDTHASTGLHLSEGDPDGAIAGTPLQAVFAARSAQQRFSGVTVHVRAIDNHTGRAHELGRRLAPYVGAPPNGVDVEVIPRDWIEAASDVVAEIVNSAHDRGGRSKYGPHDHRSLWFLDPYGPGSLDHETIAALPRGSEVIINLDVMGVVRLIGKARAGYTLAELELDRVFGRNDWRLAEPGMKGRVWLANLYADSFPTSAFKYGMAHPLRPTGSQFRALVHLTNASTAVAAFDRAVKSALEAGTVAAGEKLTTVEKDRAAKDLFGQFRGQTLTTREMRQLGALMSLSQLNAICPAAAQLGYGRWLSGQRMEWFAERTPEPTLWQAD
jgi:three-Cys-motif partner protein